MKRNGFAIAIIFAGTAINSVLGVEPVTIIPGDVLQHCERERMLAMNRWEKDLSEEKRKPLKQRDRDRIRLLEESVKQFKEPAGVYWPDLENQMGSVGAFRRGVNVRQIISATEMLAFSPETNSVILLRGVDTSATADGKGYQPKGPFAIKSNYKYDTVAGSTNTVLVAEPYDTTEIDKLFEKLVKPKLGKRKAK